MIDVWLILARFLVDCFKVVSLIFQDFLDGLLLILGGIVIHVGPPWSILAAFVGAFYVRSSA